MSDDPIAASRPAPIAATERIEALDVLRGFALAGIFVMNMPAFAHSVFAVPTAAPDLATADGWTALLREWLFAGKFLLLFGFAFGAGFALQLRRLEDASPLRAASLLRRRLLVLLGLGLCHGALVWPGDVLLSYATVGLVLLAWRRMSAMTLIVLGAICLFVPAGLEALAHATSDSPAAVAGRAEVADLVMRHDVAFGRGSFTAAVGETLHTFAATFLGPDGVVALVFGWLQLGSGILLGWWLGRRGLLHRLAEAAPAIRRAQALSFAVVLGCAALWWFSRGADALPGQPAPFTVAFARGLGRLALAACYATTLARVVLAPRGPLLRSLIGPLAAAGRMPLTNYLLQSALGVSIFYGWGLGWWGRTGALAETLLALLLFVAVQLPISVLWLRRFRFGPVEMLWRRLTYGSLGDRKPNSRASSS